MQTFLFFLLAAGTFTFSSISVASAKPLRFAGVMSSKTRMGGEVDTSTDRVRMHLSERGNKLIVTLHAESAKPWKTEGAIVRRASTRAGDRALHVEFAGATYDRTLQKMSAETMGHAPIEIVGGKNRAVFTLQKNGSLKYRGHLTVETRQTRALAPHEAAAYSPVLPRFEMKQAAQLSPSP